MTEYEKNQRWVAYWQRAGVALGKQHELELRNMSDVQALKAAHSILETISFLQPTLKHSTLTSGLVLQQKLFQRLRQ